MSRISDHISVSDSYTVLMDDYLKENQSLREQLRQHDQENALVKVRRAFKKKWNLCVNLSPRTIRAARKRNQRKVTQRSMCL